MPCDLIFGLNPATISIPPQYGIVGNLRVDGAPRWNLFVIVGYEEKTKTFSLVFPRIRLIRGVLHLGQDKLCPEEIKKQTFIRQSPNSRCICAQLTKEVGFYCHCGAYDYVKKTYVESFESIGKQAGYYKVKTFTVDKLPYFLDLERTNLDYLEYLDEPLFFCPQTNTPCMFCTRH
jgi:hypothetical protein